MSVNRTQIPKNTRDEVLIKSRFACCICHAPILNLHHIDENPNNNVLDNLIALCPNHHKLAHDKTNPIGCKLNQSVLKKFRDKWYKFCEDNDNSFDLPMSDIGILKIKNFISSLPSDLWAKISIKKTFSHINPDFETYTNHQIIDELFKTPNLEAIETYLSSLKILYEKALLNDKYLREFKKICACWYIDYDEL